MKLFNKIGLLAIGAVMSIGLAVGSVERVETTAASAATTTATDTLTRATTGVTGTSYKGWTASGSSGALYEGQSAGGNDSIQLRTTNSNSGIVTTSSGGKLKSITVVWNTNTTSERTLDVYGKNEAYSVANDLYDNSTRGTKLGSIVYGTSTSLTIEGDYTYLGLRSNNGAMYITSIAVEWEYEKVEKTLEGIKVATEPSKTTYGVGETLDLSGLVIKTKYDIDDDYNGVTTKYTTNPENGYKFVEADKGPKTITVTSTDDDSKSCTFDVSVIDAYPTKLSRSGLGYWGKNQTFADTKGTVSATYTDGNEIENLPLTDSRVSLVIDGDVVDPNASVVGYNNSTAFVTYTDQGKTVQTSSFTIYVVESLYIDSFEQIPSNLVVGEEPVQVSAKYYTYLGEPTVTVQSTNEACLAVTNVTKNHYDPSGYVNFEIEGLSEGQASIIVTLTVGEVVVSDSFSVTVFGSEPVVSGEWTRISTYKPLNNGQYVIGAKADEKYYAIGGTLSSGKFEAQDITVSNDKITGGTYGIATLTKYNGGYTIQYGGSYLAYNSSTNFKTQATEYQWNLQEGTTSDVFNLVGSGTTRAIAYRISAEKFGAYATSNFGDADYCELQIFELVSEASTKSGFELVNEFVGNYMHMNDVAITNTGDTGACRGETGYYAEAKKAFNAMVTEYTGQEDLVEIFETKFNDAYRRYLMWAAACNDSNPFVGAEIQSNRLVSNFIFNQSGDILVLVLALAATTILGGIIIFKRKKFLSK